MTGEAKRRQQAIKRGDPVDAYDPISKRTIRARRAPGVLALRRQFETTIMEHRAGYQVEMQVPCNGCTACCHHRRIDVDPARERPEDLAHLDLIPDPDAHVAGGMMLRKRTDGACVHLGSDGCTVREHRPAACRLYDCRIAGVLGIVEPYGDHGHRSPLWVADQHTTFDRLFVAVLQFTAMQSAAQNKGIGEPAEIAEAVYVKVAAMIPGLMKLADRLDHLSPAEREMIIQAAPAAHAATERYIDSLAIDQWSALTDMQPP